MFSLYKVILMSNDDLMLLFTAGIFLIALLTFIVLLIEKISKK
ncbi:putative holin-like toxin [uncultured Clostridium sp.]